MGLMGDQLIKEKFLYRTVDVTYLYIQPIISTQI